MEIVGKGTGGVTLFVSDDVALSPLKMDFVTHLPFSRGVPLSCRAATNPEDTALTDLLTSISDVPPTA